MLDAFLDERAAELAPLGPDAARLIAEARTAVRGGKRFRAAFCHWGYRAIRPDVADAGRARPRLRLAGDAARERARPRRLHGRLRHPPRPPGHPPRLRGRAPRRRLARRPGPVRRRGRDPARRPPLGWAGDMLRHSGFAASDEVARAPALRAVPQRGHRRPVPRRLGPGPRACRRRHRDDGPALQVGEVLHRAAAAHRCRPRRRDATYSSSS